MLKKHAQVFEGLFTAIDLLMVSLAWVCSYYIRFISGVIPVEKGIPLFADYLRMLIFVWLIWAYVFRRFGLYKPMRGMSQIREIWLVVKANAYSVILLLTVTYLFREKSVPFSRLVFVVFWVMATIFTVSSRIFVRTFLRGLRRKGFNRRYVLVVGAGKLAANVAKRIVRHPEYGIELLGCLASDKQQVAGRAVANGSSNGSSYEMVATAAPVLGSYLDLPKILAEQEGIDQIIVALPLGDHDQMEAVLASLGDSMVDVKIVPDFHEFIQLGRQVEDFDGLPVMSIASTPLAGINRVMKRLFDIVVGTLFFVVSFPVMLLTAALVKLTSAGPVFFVQERVGLDGRTFTIFKFRTMSTDAEVNGAQFAVKGDRRVTPLGKLLRRFSFDELPQLVNVILGQMSLVGPRPERPVFISEFRKHVPRYMLRHKVQAGITGWAQVHGWRGNTSIEKRIEYDLYYIENWSLSLDMKILGLTLINGFRDRNAY